MKPSLIESRLTESPDVFSKLGEGFKKLFIDNPASQMATRGIQSAKDIVQVSAFNSGQTSPTKPIVIPIAGYGGHRKGETSENIFGKCFRDVSIKSKIIERGGLQRRNQFVMIDRAGSQGPSRNNPYEDRSPKPLMAAHAPSKTDKFHYYILSTTLRSELRKIPKVFLCER